MLIARGAVTIGGGDLRWTVALAPRLWVCAYVQHGLVVDTRLIAGSPEPARATSCVYLVLSGSIRAGDGQRWDGPTALVLSGEQLDGADGRRSLDYRAVGEPFSVVELNVQPDDLLVQPRPTPPVVTLGDGAWAAARSVRVDRDDESQPALESLLRALATEKILSSSAVDTMLSPTSRTAVLLWRAFRPMVERLYLTPTLQEVGEATGLSVRQADRHVLDFVDTFGLAGRSWRTTTRYLRVRFAAILLTAEGARVAEVAHRVGYRSADAMARAFRDAGMLSPTDLQAKARADS